MVIGLCRAYIDAKMFSAWGWRVPFLVSWCSWCFPSRSGCKLKETPVFQKMKAEGKGSKSPLTDSFLKLPKQQVRAARTVRGYRRPGCRLVHRPVLCPVLPR